MTIESKDTINIFKEKLDYFLEKRVRLTSDEEELSKVHQNAFDILSDCFETMMENEDFIENITLIKSRELILLDHSINTSIYSGLIAFKQGFRGQYLCDIVMGSLLHDIGKIFVKDDELIKSHIYLNNEHNDRTDHVTRGYDHLCKYSKINDDVRKIVLQHHERLDSKGYPNHLTENEIKFSSNLVALSNTYDSLTSQLRQDETTMPYDAVEYIMSMVGIGFKYEIIRAFFNIIIPYPIGTLVRLSDGRIGVVDSLPSGFLFRPLIKIVKQIANRIDITEVSLLDNHSLTIKEVLEKTPDPSVQSYLRKGYN